MQAIVQFLRNRRGQSLVEVALALPILVLLMLGIFDFGLYLFKNTLATEAARAGARAAAVHKSTNDVYAAMQKSIPVTLDDKHIDPPVDSARTTDTAVTVTAQIDHTVISGLIGQILGANENGKVSIVKKAVMRVE